MKIAMLLPLLPLYAAAQKTAACPNDDAACHCPNNDWAEECHMSMMKWPDDSRSLCVEGHPCQSCDWCVVPEDEPEVAQADEESQVIFKCDHADCMNWECAEWCRCFDNMFQGTYEKAGCVEGEDTCNCK
jgi:hypothetical protein